jgi:hypothetical protein
MALQKMMVCGKTYEGKMCQGDAELPYQFYAISSSDTINVVNIVMPVGGKETGFYRYPRVGENILVDDDGAKNYYLMGYLPSATDTSNNFLTNAKPQEEQGNSGDQEKELKVFEEEKNALEDEKGMILRYKQTGKEEGKEGADRYSEIGFYHKPTSWKPSDANAGDYPDKDNGYPKIDQINIQSTGDIHTAAQNHQQLKAKRFELLVNCKDTIHNNEKELTKDQLPLGDNIGDDSVLHAGDAHIRAGNRVVIKAGKEIVLQVGKTVVKISDGGFEVKSKIVNSNLTNAYDATFNMSGKGGVSMYGRDVNINSEKSFGILDTFGGSIGSKLGVVSIGGREIKAEAYDNVQYGFLIGCALSKYAQAIASGSMGVNGNVTPSQVEAYSNFAYKTFKDIAKIIKNFVGFGKTVGKYNELEGKKKLPSNP